MTLGVGVPYTARNAKRAQRLRARLRAGEELDERELRWLAQYENDHPRGVLLMERRAARASAGAASDPTPPSDAGFDPQERTDQ